MKKKTFTIVLAVFWVMIALAAVAGVTYAWFTFNPATNVVPVSSTISDGEVALLISNEANGEFGTEVVLPQSVSGDLEPVSTMDAVSFYAANLQTRQGISVRYRDASAEIAQVTIHGTLYLQSLKDNCQVFFNRDGMDFGTDPQMLAALRLALKIHTNAGDHFYVFSLDDIGSVDGATAVQTTVETGVVVGSINADGTPNYVPDPSRGLSDYFAVIGAERLPRAGRKALCTISTNEVATVEYWLYLEGCDENCNNSVQEKEASIQLSFAGVTAQ
ncbi:MAG: hypothetical protein IJL09_00175 [Lachnospiraceae bacterium]|nr:hypothetical protein [Lachnospiraceae bacterium]